MSEENLMSAAHRLNRFFRIDMNKGGLIVDDTLMALNTLDQQIALADKGAEHDVEVLRVSREVSRDLHLTMGSHGGMIGVLTEIKFDHLDKAIRAAGGRK